MTQLLEPQAQTADSTDLAHVTHWIDGARRPGTSGRSGPVYDPATGRLARLVDFASSEEVDAAGASGKAASPGWRATSLPTPPEILSRTRTLTEQHRHEIAAHLTAEHGKVPSDALGEV